MNQLNSKRKTTWFNLDNTIIIMIEVTSDVIRKHLDIFNFIAIMISQGRLKVMGSAKKYYITRHATSLSRCLLLVLTLWWDEIFYPTALAGGI